MVRVFCLIVMWTALPIFAEDIKLQWDPKPDGETWELVRIYERIGLDYIQVAEVAGDQVQAIFSITPGRHTYIARAVNGQDESSDSNAARTKPFPSSPSLW